MKYNYLLTVVDTDSVALIKPDMSEFTPEEQEQLITEINDMLPEKIKYAHDGYFDKLIVLKAKNYITYANGKVKLKGSSIRDQKKEPILLRMLQQMIQDLIDTDGQNLKEIYHSYIREAMNPQNIRDWSQKKTLTKSILDCATNPMARKNESVVYDAVKGKQMQEGDKFFVYPCILSSTTETTVLKNGKTKTKETKVTGLKCAEDYNNDIDTEKLIDRVYATTNILANVVDETIFIDYNLVKNKHLLSEL